MDLAALDHGLGGVPVEPSDCRGDLDPLILRLKLLSELLKTAVTPSHVAREVDTVDLNPPPPREGGQVDDRRGLASRHLENQIPARDEGLGPSEGGSSTYEAAAL